jgi:hypothetical protein
VDLGKNADRRQGDASTNVGSQFGKREGMAQWRWFLFAVMARFEADEGAYLRIPRAKVTRCDVATTISGASDNSGDFSRATGHDASGATPKRPRSALGSRLASSRILAWFNKESSPGVKIP